MKRGGMTLIEILVVVVIVGVLARFGIPQYLSAVERGRSAEARYILGAIHDAETQYYLDRNTYGNVTSLAMNYPSSCAPSHYFSYNYTPLGAGPLYNSYVISATRCTSGGKSPQSYQTYVINMTDTGVLNGTEGFI